MKGSFYVGEWLFEPDQSRIVRGNERAKLDPKAIQDPARTCGYRVEDETLVTEILTAVSQERGAMPLLAFAASKLWEKRDREQRRLTRAAYFSTGGVDGALAQHAEETLESIGVENHPVVREIFRNLATAQATRVSSDREELLSSGIGMPRPGFSRSSSMPGSSHRPARTWYLLSRHPERFSAAIPMAGAPRDSDLKAVARTPSLRDSLSHRRNRSPGADERGRGAVEKGGRPGGAGRGGRRPSLTHDGVRALSREGRLITPRDLGARAVR